MNKISPVRNSISFGAGINRELFEKTITKLDNHKNILKGIDYNKIVSSLGETAPTDIKFGYGELMMGSKSPKHNIKEYVLYLLAKAPLPGNKGATFNDIITLNVVDNSTEIRILDVRRKIEIDNGSISNPFAGKIGEPEQKTKEYFTNLFNKVLEQVNR